MADRFKNANSFDVKGVASTVIPGSSWRATYEFETLGAQPGFLPLSVRGPSMKVISTVGQFTETQVNADATEPKPRRGFMMVPLGRYTDLGRRLIDAQKIGTETITVLGRAHSCEIIDAVYDTSPEFKPHSGTMHKRFSIDPSDMLVLRETQSSSDGLEWTANITSTSFDLPPSGAMVQALRDFAAQAKDRSDWIGRSIPDLLAGVAILAIVRNANAAARAVIQPIWRPKSCVRLGRKIIPLLDMAKKGRHFPP